MRGVMLNGVRNEAQLAQMLQLARSRIRARGFSLK
jgi:hypothetical protein